MALSHLKLNRAEPNQIHSNKNPIQHSIRIYKSLVNVLKFNDFFLFVDHFIEYSIFVLVSSSTIEHVRVARWSRWLFLGVRTNTHTHLSFIEADNSLLFNSSELLLDHSSWFNGCLFELESVYLQIICIWIVNLVPSSHSLPLTVFVRSLVSIRCESCGWRMRQAK